MGNVRSLFRLLSDRDAESGNPLIADAAEIVERLSSDAPMVLWRYSPAEDRFLYISSYAEMLFGYPLASWLEPGILAQRVRSDDHAGLCRFFADVLNSGSAGEFSFRLNALNDAEVSVRCFAVPLRGRQAEAPVTLGGLLIDMSSHVALATALGESEQRFRHVMEQVPNISVQGYDKDRRVAFWNTASERLYGYSADEAMGQLLEDLIIPDFMRDGVRQHVDAWVNHGAPVPPGELSLKRKDGSLVAVYSSHVMVRNPVTGPQMYCLDVELTDVKAAERQARESELRFRRTFEEAPVGICIYAPDGVILDANPAFCRITGHPVGSLRGAPYDQITHPDDLPRDRALFLDCVSGNRSGYVTEKRIVKQDGREIWVENTVSLLRDEEGSPTQFIGIAEDITERRASRERIAYMAHHDALTGLPNRSLLQDRLNMALAHATRSARPVALLFIDLDRFKNINDSLGHVVGDSLLQAVGTRLSKNTRATDTVSRQGGDEFIVLLGDIESHEAAMNVAYKMVELLEEPYEVSGHLLACTASIGVAIFPDHGRDVDTLMRHADMAMYSAKDGGRNTVRMFQSGMTRNAVERLKIENALRKALERQEFELYYQPQVEIATGRLIGLEALLRWNSGLLGMVSPASFIPVAEDTGLIVPIGEWVLNEACRQLRKWQEAGLPVVPVAVNLSALQFNRGDIVRSLREVFERTGVDPALIEIELTESLLMSNADGVLHIMRELKTLGVGLSIDDFGTGYSSLSYLKRFPVDRLKVDRSFVRDVPDDPDDAAIVHAIVQLGHSLKIQVIAEGVESSQQVEFLRAEGCQAAQGFLFAKPAPVGLTTPILAAGLVPQKSSAAG